MAGVAITSTALNTARRACFAQDRLNNLYIVNGLQRGKRWDGLTAAVEDMGITGPAAAATLGTGALGNPNGTYLCAWRYIDDTVPTPVASVLSTTASVSPSSDVIAWTDLADSSEARAVKKELYRTGPGGTNVFYKVTTINHGTTSYNDDVADATLLASDYILLTEDDGSLASRRQVVPPNFLSVAEWFQDRMWYAVAGDYSTGTVTTSGTGVTGLGTAWTAEMDGRYILFSNETKPYLIDAVGGATSITLATAVANNASGLSYVIFHADTTNNGYYRTLLYSEIDEAESVPLGNSVTLQNNTGDDDKIVGLKAWEDALFVFCERHKHVIQYLRQPNIDANAIYIDDRGAFNHWCVAALEDTIYAMDAMGPYAFSVGGLTARGARTGNIGLPLQDLWRDGTIDFSKSATFTVAADRPGECIRFFVAFTGDSGDRPTRCLVWNTRTETWDVEHYPQQIGAACSHSISGRMYCLAGMEDFTNNPNQPVFKLASGTSDGVSAVVTGTATAGGNNTLTDSGKSWTNDAYIGVPVAITAGTGKGQIRTISDNTGTVLTVSANWTTNPDTSSEYMVGAVEWTWKSRRFRFVESKQQNARQARIVFTPTTNAATLDLRLYPNYTTTPLTYEASCRFGTGTTVEAGETDVVFTLTQDGDNTGSLYANFDGRVWEACAPDRFVTLELRGFQGDDAIRIHEIIIRGVEQDDDE